MNGIEWVVDAWGCEPESLRDTGAMGALFEAMIRDLKLRPVGEIQWHKFPEMGELPECACSPSLILPAIHFRNMDHCA
jgi:DNA modification methylase